MSEHFTSVLRVGKCEKVKYGSPEGKIQMFLESDRKTATLQFEPAPPNSTAQSQSFVFDQVYATSDDNETVYRDGVRKIVESTLLGYNGAVISLGVGEGEREAVQDVIGRASEQIFRCVNKSKSSGSGANLVVNCSFVAIADEKAYDLLTDSVDRDGPSPLSLGDTSPQASSHEAGSTSQVLGVLQHGREREGKLCEQLRAKHPDHSFRVHHTVLSLTVEYSHFGSMNAPVSGTLSFVRLSSPHPLAHRDQYPGDGGVEQNSLLSLAEVVVALTPQPGHGEAPQPQPVEKTLYSKSLLTRLLEDAVGGNCKTVFMCHVQDSLSASSLAEVAAAVRLVSRARHIHNRPNKRDLAERALMSAYMRQLRKQYKMGGSQGVAERNVDSDTDHDSREGER